MSDDGWIPERYFDEIIPEFKGHPTQWVCRLDDGAPALLDFDGEKGEMALADGDYIDFVEMRLKGEAVLTIADDGSWAVDHDMPAEANHVFCSDVGEGLGSNTVEGLVADWKEQADPLYGTQFEPGRYAIHYSWWSDAVPFRFDAGSNSFLQVAS